MEKSFSSYFYVEFFRICGHMLIISKNKGLKPFKIEKIYFYRTIFWIGRKYVILFRTILRSSIQ
nr:hypothetical protein [Leptospira borgpetersenii]